MTDIKPDLVVTDLPDPAPSSPLEALEWLGDTVEEVVEGLRARGIKGQQRVANACPLAAYLNIWWGEASASVWQDVSVIDEDRDFYWTSRTPDHLFTFASLFDYGAFPDLVAD